MKPAAVILILLLTATAFGQRNSTSEMPLPTTASAGTVTLSLAEYNRLVEMSTRKPKLLEAPPMPFVLTRAVFKLRVENQTLMGTVSIDGTSLEKGPVKAPLTTGLLILQADQSGNPLPLLLEGSNHAAILNGPGPFAVSLGVASALTIDAGRAAFMLPVPLAGSSLLSLELPGNHANVHIEPGIITKRDTVNGHTVIEASLEPGKAARVWWTTREIAAPVAQREVRFLSDIKSVVSVGDSQLRLTALCDVNVIQGEAAEFKVPIPAGYELTAASGSSLESSELSSGVLTLRVHDPAKRNHQFLIAIERTHGEPKAEPPLFAFEGAQRETGELLVEGIGAMELRAKESDGLRRMDVREANAITRSLSHFPLQAAFRYNRKATDAPKLELEWQQFSDADVLSAVAERATVTTLTNVEGRSLTEVTLKIRNHSQPFVKVELPPGAQLFTAEVAGQTVKPVEGTDGIRVPLLRAGMNASGAYTVSFVYLSTGTRFGKNGSYDMGLPRLDVPINLLTWEVSLPERLEVKQFGGNALSAEVFPAAAQNFLTDEDELTEVDNRIWTRNDLSVLEPGEIGGIVVDPNGAVVSGAEVTVETQTGSTLNTSTDSEGRWVIAGLPPGPVKVKISSPGFQASQQDFYYSGSRAVRMGNTLQVGTVAATVTVTSDMSLDGLDRENRRIEEMVRKNKSSEGRGDEGLQNSPSQNVVNLQRRVAGILPVRIEVPRSGRSYRFVRPLVLGEETKITFQYKSK
ncbi:MAG TPA: carboxypeptidase-like regulatory domain-containing protein [Pyrinomonadaceae bacterium]|nr:carboxypeptidase-like regulatory domain-containing protein [Pyrinomonadaceae bacterium]